MLAHRQQVKSSNLEGMRNKKFYIIVIAVLFVLYAVYYGLNSDKILAEEGVYSIAKIENVQPGGRGCARLLDISFIYNNVKHTITKICESNDSINKSFIGKRFFIKIVPNELERAIDFNFRCSVPDTITEVPHGGFSQEWMREHFPTCIK
jgi:hypothetical protein